MYRLLIIPVIFIIGYEAYAIRCMGTSHPVMRWLKEGANDEKNFHQPFIAQEKAKLEQ